MKFVLRALHMVRVIHRHMRQPGHRCRSDRRLCEETSARLARNRLPPWSAESYSNRDSRNTLDMRDRLLWLLLSLERPLGVP